MKNALLVALVGLFLSSIGRADRVVNAYGGNAAGDTVPIRLDSSLERLIPLFAGWEAKLKPHADVEFLLGAGDLRRAILGMASDGPGDIEVFIHFKDRALFPYAHTKAMIFLKSHGIDLEDEIRGALQSPNKKIDAFVRDKVALENDGPYVTELSVFEGHGDTSLNALVYSPARNTILGAETNLEALRRGKITYLEVEKMRKLEEPKEISLSSTARGEKHFSDYPSTILRQDFRSTRLEVDLFLQRDYLKGRITLDEPSFEVPLKGTELYFGDLPESVVSRFPLYTKDDTYLQVFLKMFRKRTNEQLSQIRAFLYANHPRKVELWKQMGLDVDLLTEPRLAGADVTKLEFVATHRNARFDILRPLIKNDFTIANPFTDESVFSLWAANLKGVPVRGIPLEVLELYSAGLHWHCIHFDELNLEEKRQTLNSYQRALTLFSGKAYDKLVRQVTFRNSYLPSFNFIRPDRLEPNSTVSLLDFVSDEFARAAHEGVPAPQLTSTENVNGEVYAQIEEAMAKAKRQKKPPVIVVDLDNTLLESSSRILSILHAYDAEMKTNWFSNLKHADLPTTDYREFLLKHLKQKVKGYRVVTELVENIWRYVKMNEWNPEFVAKAEAHSEIVTMLKYYQQRGAKLVFLTARKSFL